MNNVRKRQLLNTGNYNTVSKAMAVELGIEVALLYAHLVDKEQYFYEHSLLQEDGSFYNTVFDINLETGLTKYQQTKAIKKLKEEGFVYVVNKGIPAKRHFILMDDGSILERMTNDFVEKKKERIAQHKEEMNKKRKENEFLNYNKMHSNSSVTTEVKKLDHKENRFSPQPNNKSTNNKEVQEGFSDSGKPLSFIGYLNSSSFNDEVIIECVEYFLCEYENTFNKKHPNLKYKQWSNALDGFLEFHNGYSSIEVHELEMKYMIDDYFSTNFKAGCNYSVIHFSLNEVKKVRYYEVAHEADLQEWS